MISKLNSEQRKGLAEQIRQAFTSCSYSFRPRWVVFDRGHIFIAFNDGYLGMPDHGIISIEMMCEDGELPYPKSELIFGQSTTTTDKLRYSLLIYIDDYLARTLGN